MVTLETRQPKGWPTRSTADVLTWGEERDRFIVMQPIGWIGDIVWHTSQKLSFLVDFESTTCFTSDDHLRSQ
jgi:hypothetical protein